jgi:hypothetical protein
VARIYATVGRASDNDVVLEDPTVSNHHARLSWVGPSLVIEDLSSANGTFVDGVRVKAVKTRPGAEVRLGQVPLPWSHQGLKTLLKSGAGKKTLVMPEAKRPSYVCGGCGHVGALPSGDRPTMITCESCGATLRTGKRPTSSRYGLGFWLGLFALGAAGGGALHLLLPRGGEIAQSAPNGVSSVTETIEALSPASRVSEQSASKIAAALTPMDALTRNTAVKIAARTQGPFHVEQVAEIWNAVRKGWRYVNDPEGQDYFATASETIDNGYIGDCDDFAITLASMVLAIGGKARVVVMDGPKGGHAYSEACVQGEPTKVATALRKHYKARWKSYLAGHKVPSEIAFRSSAECPIWLNLDWNAVVPGGPYETESWAVAIYSGGKQEELAASAGPAATP